MKKKRGSNGNNPPICAARRADRLKRVMARAHDRYAAAFRRLAE
jgi:hypothetical protein